MTASFNAAYLRDRLVSQYRANVYGARVLHQPFPRINAARTLLRAFVTLPLVCKLRGHVWQSEADVENGREDIWCDRCGESHSHYF